MIWTRCSTNDLSSSVKHHLAFYLYLLFLFICSLSISIQELLPLFSHNWFLRKCILAWIPTYFAPTFFSNSLSASSFYRTNFRTLLFSHNMSQMNFEICESVSSYKEMTMMEVRWCERMCIRHNVCYSTLLFVQQRLIEELPSFAGTHAKSV